MRRLALTIAEPPAWPPFLAAIQAANAVAPPDIRATWNEVTAFATNTKVGHIAAELSRSTCACGDGSGFGSPAHFHFPAARPARGTLAWRLRVASARCV
jgi:hypothetical protein